MCWSWLQRYVQEEAWNFLHGLEEEVPCTVETLQLYASWLFFLHDLVQFDLEISPTSELDMKHPTNPFCVTLAKFPVPTGSLDQVSFKVAKSPFKTFFAVERIPSPVIDIRSHDHNITTRWSQKRGPRFAVRIELF